MMRFVWLIGAHNRPDQLERLLDRLLPAGTGDRAVLHLDARSDLWRKQRDRFANHASGRVSLIRRPARIHWGHGSITVSIRRMLDEALREPFDYAHLLSGMDWPIASRARIVADIAAQPDRPAFLTMLGAEQAERMMQWRITLDRATDWIGIAPLRAQARHELAVLERKLNQWGAAWGVTRSEPFGSPWLKGWMWWSLPRDIAARARDGLRSLERSGRLNLTACSDEHALQTIVARAFPDRLAPYRRHIMWDKNASSPRVLLGADLPGMQESDAWLARKVDMDVDDFFLDGFAAFA